jgi:hypothetical protein
MESTVSEEEEGGNLPSTLRKISSFNDFKEFTI